MIATRLSRNRQVLRKKTCSVRLNDSPTRGPAIRPAMNVPVPTVESHETSKNAISAYCFGTTGGVRITCKCRPGAGGFQETVSSTLVMDGCRHSTTKAARSRKGDHATRLLPNTNVGTYFQTG